MEKITCAAIKTENLTCVGKNHAEIIRAFSERTQQRIRGTQGFLTCAGRFVDRSEARIIALAAKQIENETTAHDTHLFSEDL